VSSGLGVCDLDKTPLFVISLIKLACMPYNQVHLMYGNRTVSIQSMILRLKIRRALWPENYNDQPGLEKMLIS